MSSFILSAVCSMCLTSFISVFGLYLTVTFILKLCSKSNAIVFNQIPCTSKATHISAITIFVCLWLTSLNAFVFITVQLLSDHVYAFGDAAHTAASAMYFAFFKLWLISAYIFFFCRLISSFQESVYAISKRIIYTHIVIMFLILSAAYTSFALIYASRIHPIFLQIFLGVDTICTVGGEIYLACSFNQRLFHLVASQGRSVAGKTDSALSEAQRSLLLLIRKNTLLATIQTGSISMMSTFYVIGVILSGGTYWPFGVHSVLPVLFVVFDTILGCLACLVSLCVYLAFKMNEPGYLRLCKPCDAKCASLYAEITRERLNARIAMDDIQSAPDSPSYGSSND